MTLFSHQQRRHYRTRRLGAGTMMFMVFLVVFLLLLMLVVNYTYLAYSQLRTGEVTDTLARTAATELLDEDLLQAGSNPSQFLDVEAAQDIVTLYLQKLNDLADERQHLRYVQNPSTPEELAATDVIVTPGRVEDASQPVVAANFTPYDPDAPDAFRLNTLAIGASRTKNGSNPLYLFVRNTFTPQAATIGTVSYVTLDSRVIGFRPTNLRSTPIVPISISEVAWTSSPRIPIGGHNDRDDFRGTLKDGVSGNLCMLNFRQGNTVDVDVSEIIQQVKFGTFEAQIDVTDSNYLGPIVPTVVTQRFPAEITAPSGAEANQLVSAFNSIQGQRRIFPLHNPGTLAGDEITITGFVSATILGAHLNGSHLHVDLEPEFVLHPTAVTAPVYDDNNGPPEAVPENVYIHKLRLSR